MSERRKMSNSVLAEFKDMDSSITALKKLGTTTRDKRRARRMVSKNKDTIKELLKTLNDKPKFTQMVEYSVECLKNLAVDEVSVEEMIDEGVIDTLLKILTLNPYNEAIMAVVNKALQGFSKNEYLAKLIGQKMGGGPFALSMKKHVEPETLESTAKTIVQLCASDDNIDIFVADGMVGVCEHVLKHNLQHEEVIAATTEVMKRVAGHKDYALQVIQGSAVENILEAVQLYPNNLELVTSATALTAKLAAAGPDCLEKLKRLGAVDILVAVLEVHPDNAALLAMGGRALAALAGEEDVLGCLIQVGTNLVTANALAKISSLMLVEENVDIMIQNEGVDWLLSALKCALGDESEVASKILSAGCRALMRIATDEHKVYSIMQKGGIKLLVQVITAHVADLNVATAAIGALTKCVSRHENATFVVRSNGIQAAMAIKKSHPDSEKAAKYCLDFFNAVGKFEQSSGHLVSTGAVAEIVDTLNRFSGNPELACLAMNVLAKLSTNEAHMPAVVEAGGLEALISVLLEQSDNSVACKQSMLLLETAAKVPSNVAKLRELGMMDAILKVIETHPDDAEIQETGTRTLGMVAGEVQLKQAVQNVAELAGKIQQAPHMAKMFTDKFTTGVSLLANFALVDENVPCLLASGAVQALIAAFEASSHLPEGIKKDRALLSCVQGMLRLSKQTAGAEELVACGAFVKVLAAAIQNPENEEFAEVTMLQAAQLTTHTSNVKQMVLCIEDIIRLAQAHPFNEKLLAAATHALGLIAIDEESAKRVIAAGGVSVVTESIFANIENPTELLNGLQVLAQLAVDDMTAAGAIDAILEAIRRYPEDASVVLPAVQALCRLLVNEEVACLVGEKGGVLLLVKAMREHYKTEGICEVDMMLLDSLASIPENAGLMLEEELRTVELIKWIQEAWPDNSQLGEAATRLLQTLCGPSEADLLVTDENAILDQDQCEVLLNKIRSGELDSMQMMMEHLAALSNDPRNARMLVKNGCLQALAQVMKDFKDDENVFYAAATAFANMTENGGEDAMLVLDEPSLIEALCEMIQPNERFASPMNMTSLSKAIAAAAKMKMLKPEMIKQLMEGKSLEALMKILCESDDAILLANTSRLLGKLSNDDDAAAAMAGIGNLRELIMAMRRNIKNQEFLKYGIYLLSNLCVNDEIKGQVGIEGGVQLILLVMQTYPDNSGLVENCCFSLSNLSIENDVNNSFIVACKGIETLLAAMGTHTQAEDLLESAVDVLCNLCHENDTNKDLVIKKSGAPAIVECILHNFSSLDLLLTSFRTLGTLAYNYENTSQIIKAGGVQGIVAGLTVHSEEVEIIDIAIRVLTNLASELDDEGQQIMAQEGAVQAIVEVATNYTDNLDMETSAFGCLCNLARAEFNASMIIKQGGVEAALAAAEALQDDAELIAKAMNLIATLSLAHGDIERLLDAGACAGVVSALQVQSEVEEVLLSGLGAISNMSHSEAVAKRLTTDAPVIPAIMTIIDNNMSNAVVLGRCYKALGSLARDAKNAAAMAEPAYQRLCANFAAHWNDESFMVLSLSFLGNLCVHEAASLLAMSTDVIKSICMSLSSQRPRPKVLIRGCMALGNMAYGSKELRERMKADGVIPSMEKIVAEAVEDDVKQAAQQCIESVNRVEVATSALPFMTYKQPVRTTKSAKELFGDDAPKKKPELSREDRNFLVSGALLVKHSNHAKPKTRHLSVDPDLKFIICKDPKKAVEPKQKMKVFKMKAIERGRCTPQLMRKRYGKWLAKEECSFAIIGRDRTFDIECVSEKNREEWISALETLMAYAKAVKLAGQKFGS